MAKLITLSKGLVTIIDDDDYKTCMKQCWYALWNGRTFYACNRGVGLLHRYLLMPQSTQEVDHINHNPLDNRRANLRVATHAQNQMNLVENSRSTSGYKGVSFMKSCGKWRAYIVLNQKQIHLGLHATPKAASRAYDNAARRLFRIYACPNAPGTSTVEV